MNHFTYIDIIMAIPLGVLILSIIFGVGKMILVEFMKSTWTDVLAISIMLWATASAVYLVLRSSL